MAATEGMQSTVHSCATSTAVQVNVLLATQHASPPNSSTTTTPSTLALLSTASCLPVSMSSIPPTLSNYSSYVKYTTNSTYSFYICTTHLPFPLPFPPSSPSAPPTVTLEITQCVRVQQNQSPQTLTHLIPGPLLCTLKMASEDTSGPWEAP